MAELVERGVDYIFFPDLYTVPHPGFPSRQNYGCPYMQMAFKMVNRAMDLEKRGIPLLAPTIAFSLGEKELHVPEFHGSRKKTGPKRGFGYGGPLEAFLDSLSGEPLEANPPAPSELTERMEHRTPKILSDFSLLSREGTLYLPQLYPYGELGREALRSLGIAAELCPRNTAKSLDMGKEHILTNEYLSFSALLGEVLQTCGAGENAGKSLAFLIPQTEVESQFGRLLRTLLNKTGYGGS